MAECSCDHKFSFIRQLPLKDKIEKDDVILIEDLEDTKKMPVSVFLDQLNNLPDIDNIVGQLKNIQELMNKSVEIANRLEEQEQTFAANERARQNAEIRRTEQFNDWEQSYIQHQEFYSKAEKSEQARVNAENQRVEEFNNMKDQFTQWGVEEQARQDAEDRRTETYNNTIGRIDSTLEECEKVTIEAKNQIQISVDTTEKAENLVNEVNQYKDEINNRLTEYENAVSSMEQNMNNISNNVDERITQIQNTINNFIAKFHIGDQIPDELEEGEVYYQYF